MSALISKRATVKAVWVHGITKVINAFVPSTPISPINKARIGASQMPIQSLRRAKRRNPSEKKKITQNQAQKFA